MNQKAVQARDANRKQRRDGLAYSILPLYASGRGHKAIAKELQLSPRIVRTILIEQGVYQPGLLKKLSGGPNSRSVHLRPLETRTRRLIRDMKRRVKRCLDKKPERERCTPIGLSGSEAFKWRYDNDPRFRIYQLLRRRMRKMICEGVKKGRSRELVGCTTEEVRAHLERQFAPGMTWENMGTGPGLWQIDHIIPCISFDLTREEQQRQCFHWTNLQPLWSIDNLLKADKIIKPQLSLLLDI